MKAKTMQVSISGKTYLVQAQTQAGAVRDVLEHVSKELRKSAVVDLATGEQIYQAGMTGEPIIGTDKYKREIDPNQMALAGIPETTRGEMLQ